jgi:hypothetical protein
VIRDQLVTKLGNLLGLGVRGYLAYYAVLTNARAITSFTSFVYYVTWRWKRALGRRSQKERVSWERMALGVEEKALLRIGVTDLEPLDSSGS